MLAESPEKLEEMSQAIAYAQAAHSSSHSEIVGEYDGRNNDDKLKKLHRSQMQRFSDATQALVRMRIAFGDVDEVPSQTLHDLKAVLNDWTDWLDINSPIADVIMRDLAQARRSMRGSTNYEQMLSEITTVEIFLTIVQNAYVDFVMYLKTVVARLDPVGSEIVGEATGGSDVENFLKKLSAS